VLARHDVKTAYEGSMCGTLVARRGETDINGVYVFTQRLATRRAAGPVAEAEGSVAVGLF
jgi:molybdate-binding protein